MSSYHGEMQRMQSQIDELEKIAGPTKAVANFAGAAAKWTKGFGQRQFHGLTDWLPQAANREAGLAAIGFKVPKAGDRAALTQAALKNVQESKITGHLPKRVQSWLASAEGKSGVARREAMLAGDTSLPGLARNIVTNPLATAKRTAKGVGATGLVAGGAFAAPGVYRAAKDRDIGHGAGTLAENAMYLAPLPIAPMMIGAGYAGRGAAAVGRGVQAVGRGMKGLIRPGTQAPAQTQIAPIRGQ